MNIRKQIIFLTSIMILFILAGCSNSYNLSDETTKSVYTNITADELIDLMNKEDVYLIDTHIPEQIHIKGTDKFIPYNEIMSFADEFPKDKKIVLYCRSGSMSEQAAKELASAGFSNVYNLLGGTNEWRNKGYSFEEPSLFIKKSSGGTDSGDVLIELTPLEITDDKLVLQIGVNTHSIDLSQFNLNDISFLEYDGKRINPSEAPSLSGHHSSGKIVFNTDEKVKAFKVEIQGIPSIEARIFEWRLE